MRTAVLATVAVGASMGLGDARLFAQSNSERLAAGSEIFHREFEFQAAEQETDWNDADVLRRLRAADGDGLGPMFNARSCVACHARGGGAGVERNVTLLTIDPRSPLISDAKRVSPHTAILGSRLPRAPLFSPKFPRLDPHAKRLRSLFPPLISRNGLLSLEVVVHESSSRAGYDLIRDALTVGVPGGVRAEWFDRQQRTSQAIADRPVIAGRAGDIDFYLSQRNSPALFGLGLIDQITRVSLEGIAKRQSVKTGGFINGRVGTGKFGWRAQTATLSQFVQGACVGELGLQLPGSRQPGDISDADYVSLGNDLSPTEVHELVSFVQAIPAPQIRKQQSADFRRGKRLFATIGCQDCHVENNGPAKQIYSDLLLHDMGRLLQAASPAPVGVPRRGKLRRVRPVALSLPRFSPTQSRADRFIDAQILMASGMEMGMDMGMGMEMGMDAGIDMLQGEVSGSSTGFQGSSFGYSGGSNSLNTPVPFAMDRPIEPRFPFGNVPDEVAWETNPDKATWDALQREWRTPPLWGVADTSPYLHDGRATTLDAAIRWHDGEAKGAATTYRELIKAEQTKLIVFLKSMRAPGPIESQNDSQDAWINDFGPPPSDESTSQTDEACDDADQLDCGVICFFGD